MRPGPCSALVTEEVGARLETDTAVTVRYDARRHATFAATWSAPHVPGPSPFRVGRQFELVPRGAIARVQETGAPATVDSYEGLPGSFAREVRAATTVRQRRRARARSDRQRQRRRVVPA